MNNEEKILAMLETMQGDIAGIKQEQTQTNIRLDNMDARFDRMDSRFENLEQRMTKAELTHEHFIVPQIQAILEGNARMEAALGKVGHIEKVQEEHDTRIWALEQVVRAK